jgi:hypothetical protein
MGTSSKTEIKVRGFSSVYEQMCNFLAVSKTGQPEETIRGLVTLCFVSFPDQAFSTPDHLRDTIERWFGVSIPNHRIESAVRYLEESGTLSRPAGSNYLLRLDIRDMLHNRIQESVALENRVKSSWIESIRATHPSLPPEDAWAAFRKYLQRAFRRHGSQAAALLDPTIDTPPEYDASLSILLQDAVMDVLDEKYHQEAKKAISEFMAKVGTDSDRTRYITQLADAAFNFYSLEVPPDLAKGLSSRLNQLTLFLDTNFLFGILGLHHNSQVEVSLNLLRAIQAHNLPFKLYYHEATARELTNTVSYYTSVLQSRRWTQTLSRAAANSGYLSGIELKFHAANATNLIDVDEFLRPYHHFDELLKQKGIAIYRSPGDRLPQRIELLHEYQEFLKRNGRGDKLYAAVDHDATVLDVTRQIRSSQKSTLGAGALLISCDYFLYRFDWETAQSHKSMPSVLLPNIFWQVLRPYVPSDRDFEKSFAETFALPEFRAIGSGASKACSKMLQILATYQGVPEETAFKMLSNDLLLERLKATKNDAEFRDCVEVAFVEENKHLLEEKTALSQQLELQKREHETTVQAQAEHTRELERQKTQLQGLVSAKETEVTAAQRKMGELEEQARATTQEAQHEANAKNNAEKLAAQEKTRRKDIEHRASHLALVAAIAVSLVLILLFEGVVHLVKWQWLLLHNNGYALRALFDIFIAQVTFGFFKKEWRKVCWGSSALFAVLLLIASLLSGPKSP